MSRVPEISNSHPRHIVLFLAGENSCTTAHLRSLEVLAHFHLIWASFSSYNATSLIRVASEVISIAYNTFSFCMNQWSTHHRISSPYECRRMIRPKPLEVTRISLSTCYTSLCDSNCCNTYCPSKGLLIEYWWCLTSILWTPFTSSSSTSHLHNFHGNKNHLTFISV